MPPPDAAPDVVEDRIAEAVLSVSGVAGLHGGTFGQAATYLPGRRVKGIRTGDEGVDVHVTLVYGIPIRDTANEIRRAVNTVVPGPVQVTIEDVEPPNSDAESTDAGSAEDGSSRGASVESDADSR